MSATLMKPKSMEEIVAMPDDGIDRWFVRGELREAPVSRRNRFHSRSMALVSRYLDCWLDERPQPHGSVLCGDVAVVLIEEPETSYGLDAAYFSAEVMAKQSGKHTVVHGAPVLAVEILSPSNVIEELNEKISTLFQVGTRLVWVLDPYWKVVDVYRPGQSRVSISADKLLEGGDCLPGFQVLVGKFFD